MTEKEKFFEEFNNGLHRIGRILLILGTLMLIAVPFIIGAINGVMPDLGGFAAGLAKVGVIYIPVAIVEQLQTQIENMKRYLPSIVQGYGYKNVKEFQTEYRASKAEYDDYKSAVSKWEQQTGNKVESDSIQARLQKKQQEVKERENNRLSHQHKKDRGDR